MNNPVFSEELGKKAFIPPIEWSACNACVLGHVQLFATPWTAVAHQAPLSMEFPRQEFWGGLPSPTPDLPDPGIKPRSLASPPLASEFFTSVPPGKSPNEEQCYLSEKVWKDKTTLKEVFSSVQSLSHVQLFVTPEPQHTRPPCPSPTPRVHSNSRPLSRWCHPAISSSIVPFSCPQSFPASGKRWVKWVSSSHQVAKELEFQLQHQSFQWTPRTDLL